MNHALAEIGAVDDWFVATAAQRILKDSEW